MFSCKKVRILSPFLLFLPLKSYAKPPCCLSLQTIESLSYFSKPHLLHETCLEFSRQFSCSAAPIYMKLLLDNVVHGIGSLEDMEIRLEQMNMRVTPDLATKVIHSCKILPASTSIGSGRTRSRRLLRFFIWCLRSRDEDFGDDVFNCAIRAFTEMKDLTAMAISISELQKMGCRMDSETFVMVTDTLVKAGKVDEAILLFRNVVEKKMPYEWSMPFAAKGMQGRLKVFFAVTGTSYNRRRILESFTGASFMDGAFMGM